MQRHRYSWFVTLFMVVIALQSAAPTVVGQVRPGGVRVPGTTVARESPLLNWTGVTASEFTLAVDHREAGSRSGSSDCRTPLSLLLTIWDTRMSESTAAKTYPSPHRLA